MTTAAPAVAAVPLVPERCDRCPATARVRVELGRAIGSGELLFCVHHAREHRGPLLAIGARMLVLPP